MRHFTAWIALGLSFLGAACTQEPRPVEPAVPGATATASVTTPPTFVVRFDAASGELPEGLVIGARSALVGFAPSSRVVSIDLDTGVSSPFGQLPTPGAGKGFMTGLAQAKTGELYAGLASFTPEVAAGIYRIPAEGGAATLFAHDAALPFPNGLALDTDGSLWTTDSGTGSVFRIGEDGTAERWATGELLTGQVHNCGPKLGPEFAIGANGIVVESDAIYVVNNDKATLVKIPRGASGQAGIPSIEAGPDCEKLGGADGLVRAPDGSFLVAINRQDKLVRVTPDGAVVAFAQGAPLDFPASLGLRGAEVYVTNFALQTASAGKPTAPGLIRLLQ